MKSKVIFLFFVLFLLSVFCRVSFAAPTAPSPQCEINAEVLSVKQTQTITPPINAAFHRVDHYIVILKIFKVSVYSGSEFSDLKRNGLDVNDCIRLYLPRFIRSFTLFVSQHRLQYAMIFSKKEGHS